jgi:hypothetical protein
LKIVENVGEKPAGTGYLPGDVLAVGNGMSAADKNDYQ